MYKYIHRKNSHISFNDYGDIGVMPMVGSPNIVYLQGE